MPKIFQVVSATLLSVGLATAGTMTGWISDATCGASNAKADKASRDCAEQCLKNGAAAVFVDSADNKVYKLAGNMGAVKTHLDHKVQVTGDVKDQTLVLKSIDKAK